MEQPHDEASTGKADRDEIFRKVGRNVLLFQQAERWLKWLAGRKRITGTSDEIHAEAEKLRNQMAGETLGTVMRRTIGIPAPGEREQARIDAAMLEQDCVHLEIGFEIKGSDSATDAAWRNRLEALVSERNELVHHFLDQFDLETPDGCQTAGNHLDRQHARYAPLVEDLRRHCDGIASAREMLFEALKQEDILAEFLHGHLRLKLEEVLRRVAAEKARADGWTYLSLAGKELAGEDHGLLKRLEEAFGHRGLKQVVTAMGGWRLHEEPTGGDGTRVLYRLADSHPTHE